jgi:hypothetical protein
MEHAEAFDFGDTVTNSETIIGWMCAQGRRNMW